jgi:Rieske Fe-S protein
MELNRREFVGATAIAVTAAMCGGCVSQHVNPVGPRTAGTTVDVGTVRDYSTDGATDQFAKSDGVMVVRSGNKIYATSAICPHQSCTMAAVGNRFCCPCHGTRYDLMGRVIKGPARESLACYGISANEQGRLIVDKTATFADADTKGSYVNVS